ISAFLLGSIPLGAAGYGGFTFVLIKEFKGEVVDNETGALVDNVEIWGEIHSTTLYFWVRFNRDTYSYKIWDANKQLLRSADDLPTVYGRFVLPISDLLGDNEKHYFQLEAKAEGYATTTMGGTFYAYEDKPLQIRLNKLKVEENLNDGEFSFDLGSSQGVMVHKRQGKMSKVQREQGYAQEDWIL
ncbi:MAG: hypothetical protein QMD00_06380, partial [Hadesarchaea archaeon]|nr:hypothetical protein [Hadesarchaea archaeon]